MRARIARASFIYISIAVVGVLSVIVGVLSVIVDSLLPMDSAGGIAASLFSVLTLVFVLSVTWHACGHTLFPTPVSFFILLAVVQAFLGSFLFLWEGKEGAELAVFTIAGSLIAFCVGVLLANAIRRFRPRLEVNDYLRRPVEVAGNSGKLLQWVVVLAVFAIVGSLFYYQGLPFIIKSVRSLVAGDDLQNIQLSAMTARIELTKGYLFLGMPYRGQGILRLLWMICLPYLVLCSILYSSTTKKGSWRWVSLVLAPVSFIFLIGSAERSRLMWVLAIFSVAGFYVQGRWLKAGIMRWGIIALSSYLFLTVLIGRTRTQVDIGALLGNLGERVVRAQAYNTVDTFRIIPQYRAHYYGEILWSYLLNLIPGPSSRTSFSYQLAQLQGRSSMSTTYASSTIFSNTYADFGVPGAILVSFFIGLLLQLVTIKLVRTPRKTILSVTLFAFLAGYLGYPLFSGTLASPIVPMVSVVGMYYVLQRASAGRKKIPPETLRKRGGRTTLDRYDLGRV